MNLKISSYSNLKYRPDIDGLRALAVLAVVAYHASPLQIKGGFIGVDIFFVISGFLISTVILQNMQNDSFSFLEFYSRRIKRIFPALLLVLVACFLFGWIGLYSDEYQQLGKHIVGGSGFLSNFLLWQESGYFDNSAESKPLLHLWSLGIEEQFYIICPFLLWFCWKQRLSPLIPILFLFVISFVLNLIGIHKDSVGAFFSPQTRFWELLIGVVLAYQKLYGFNIKPVLKLKTEINFPYVHSFISFLGLGLIVFGFLFISKERGFPGVWALFPTLGAAMIIGAGSQAWLNKNIFSNKILVWFGLISFPLYLWHWPVLSFIHTINNGNDASRMVRLLAVLSSILLAWLTYKLIEKPIRYAQKNKTTQLVFASIIVAFVGLITYKSEGYPFRTILAAKQKAWTDKPQVLSGYETSKIYHQVSAVKERDFYLSNVLNEKANIAVLGDSHANKLYWSLSDYKEMKLINIGRGTCPPLIDVEVFQNNGQSIGCQPLTNNYLHYVKEDSNIKLIIINAFYNQYRQGLILKANNKQISLEEALNNTLNYLSDSHKKIIVALDVPEVPSSCYQRNFPVWNIKFPPVCTTSKQQFDLQNKPLMKVLKSYPDVAVFNPGKTFCNEQCGEIDMHKYLYLRDGNHLNDFGLRKLSPSIHDFVRKELG